MKRPAKAVGITKSVSPHLLRLGFVTASLDGGIPLRDVQSMARHADPPMMQRYDRARGNLDIATETACLQRSVAALRRDG